MKRHIEIGVRLHLRGIGGNSFVDQILRLSAQGRCYFPKRKFGMILDTPENAAFVPDLSRLNRGNPIPGEQDRTRWKAFHLIAMQGGCIPHSGSSG